MQLYDAQEGGAKIIVPTQNVSNGKFFGSPKDIPHPKGGYPPKNPKS